HGLLAGPMQKLNAYAPAAGTENLNFSTPLDFGCLFAWMTTSPACPVGTVPFRVMEANAYWTLSVARESTATVTKEARTPFFIFAPPHDLLEDGAAIGGNVSGACGVLGSEPLGGARFRLRCLFFTVLRSSCGFERMQETAGDRRDFVDGRLERRFIGLRRLVEAADLAHELQRGGADLFVGDRRIEVEKNSDVSAH